MELSPTPGEARGAVKNGSPKSKKRARKVIQKHPKACHQKVDRAEKIVEHKAGRFVFGGKKRRDGAQLRHRFGV